MLRSFRVSSVLRAAPGDVWARAATLAGVNAELILVPLPSGGTRVVDEVAFAPRVPALGGLMAFAFELTFRWRHRRLRKMWG